MIFLYFLQLDSPTHFENMSFKHQNINLRVEHEELSSDSFLDVKICLKNEKCVTSVSKEPTFS